MSADGFLLAMTAEIARLAVSSDPKDAGRRRAIEILAASYMTDVKKKTGEKKTIEREMWLRMNYATWPGLKDDIVAAVNALPGEALNGHDLSNWVSDMHLKRGAEALIVARRRGVPRNKDGTFSMAKAAERDEQDMMGECPVTLEDALEWGRRNGMEKSGSTAEDLRATNTIRIVHGLPRFTLIADKPAQGRLPRLIRDNASV
jgi:hypothetical protein